MTVRSKVWSCNYWDTIKFVPLSLSLPFFLSVSLLLLVFSCVCLPLSLTLFAFLFPAVGLFLPLSLAHSCCWFSPVSVCLPLSLSLSLCLSLSCCWLVLLFLSLFPSLSLPLSLSLSSSLTLSYIHFQQVAQGESLVPADDFVDDALDAVPVPLSQWGVPQAGDDGHALFEVHHLVLQLGKNLIGWQSWTLMGNEKDEWMLHRDN